MIYLLFITSKQSRRKTNPRVIVAIYDEMGELITTDTKYVTKSNPNHTFVLNAKPDNGETYTVKPMIWDKDHNPLTTSYVITVK